MKTLITGHTPPTPKREPMDIQFAMFNCHINNAAKRAEVAFRDKFGPAKWDSEIQPLFDQGIMTIFHKAPTKYTKFYAETVMDMVNADLTSVIEI